MKIGALVRNHIEDIFDYCRTEDPSELGRLCNPRWSKTRFGLNYPFCKRAGEISTSDGSHLRFYATEYSVDGGRFRVTNDWYERNRPGFLTYLRELGIAVRDTENAGETTENRRTDSTTGARSGRYGASSIGNAQNLLVRNILGNLGQESFGESEWRQVIGAFSGRCAYCGAEGKLVMDHIIPINKTALGEHRLGNLAPSCEACNAAKAGKDYRDFLAAAPDRITAIEDHMARFAYAPLGDDAKLRQIVEQAHEDVRHLAERYIAILNGVMAGEAKASPGPAP